MNFGRLLGFFAPLALTAAVASESRAAESEMLQPKAAPAQGEHAQVEVEPPQLEPPSHHRLTFGAGFANTYFQGGIDGHYGDKLQRGSGHVGYAYRFARGFEFGADVAFYTGFVVLPAASVRGYIPIGSGDPVEVGFAARPSLLIASRSTRTWTGAALSLGPDVRVWLGDNIGLQIAGEATVGGGSAGQDPNDAYLSSAAFLALGASMSMVWKN